MAKNFLQHYLSDGLLKRVELDSMEPQKYTFIDEKMRVSFSDLLFNAKIGDETGYFYILFEHKSYPSNDIALKLYRYLGEIFHAKINRRIFPDVPIVIPFVIYHSKDQWDVLRILNDMIVEESKYATDVSRHIPNFEYLLFDFSQLDSEQIRNQPILRSFIFSSLRACQ